MTIANPVYSTKSCRYGAEALREAALLIRAGEPVAVPTETVYGLAADATDNHAVAAIYSAKGRPSFNPLIVHVADRDMARALAHFSPVAEMLAEQFWPGPLTLVLPVKAESGLSHLVTAGLPTVALRLPAHADLDGSVFEIAKDRRMPPASAISSLERHVLKKRLWHVGNVLLKMHNCLQLRGEFIALSPLLRKCFTRVKYILSDDINANVDENAILGERVDSSDDLATMATLEEEASAAVAAQE